MYLIILYGSFENLSMSPFLAIKIWVVHFIEIRLE